LQPYSHFVIAAQLEEVIRPDTPADYYWGAVAADIRVTAGLPRERTHLAPEKVLEFYAKYPQHKAFIQGYMVHILADLVDVQALVRQRPLMPFILHQNSPKFAQYIIESFYLTKRKVQKPVAIQHNAMLDNLGASAAIVTKEAALMEPYLQKADYTIALTYLKQNGNGKSPNPGIREIESLHTGFLVAPFLFYLANMDKLNQQVLAQIRATEAFNQICG
jgi:hypothetical protein